MTFYEISGENINNILDTIRSLFDNFKLLIFLIMGVLLAFWIMPTLIGRFQDWLEYHHEWVLEDRPGESFRKWRAILKKEERIYLREAEIKAFHRRHHTTR